MSYPQDFGAYLLPHHRVVDGKLVTSLHGVMAAGAAVQGARGGTSIPEGDLPAVKHHLAEHYHQFDRKAPWEESAEQASAAQGAPVQAAEPAGVPAPSHLPSSHVSEDPPMDKAQMKQHAQALQLAKVCSRMMAVAQAAAESDDPALQALGTSGAEYCAKVLGAYKAAFPGMGEPDADDMMMSAEEVKGLKEKAEKLAVLSAEVDALKGVVSLCETLTGKKGVELRPALVQLSAKAEESAQVIKLTAEQSRLALLDSMVKTTEEGGTQQILPGNRALFESFTLAELEAYKATAPKVGPKPAKATEGANQFNGNATTAEELQAAQPGEGFALLGIDPNSPWASQKGQGVVRVPAL